MERIVLILFPSGFRMEAVMSANALRDLNTLPASERKIDNSGKGSFVKPCLGNANGNTEERRTQVSSPSISVHASGVETDNPRNDVCNMEVEYIESENLSDVEDVDTTLKVLGSPFWISFLLVLPLKI